MRKPYFSFFLAFLLLISNVYTNAQIINTYAGIGIAGYSGDGGSASSAKLNNPHGIAIDNSGNLFIADLQNSCIRKVTPAGVISTVAGIGVAGYSGDGGPATLAKLNLPFAVAVDATGNIYISDNMNSRIRKVNALGIISTIAGTGVTGYNGDGIAATSAELYYPGGICHDAAGDLLITDQYNNRIRKVNSTTGFITTIGGTGLTGFSGDSGPATSATMNRPNYITTGTSGAVFFTDNNNHRIRKIDPAGVITTVAGNGSGGYTGDGIPAITAELNYPGGISLDNSGNLYIADYYNNRIRKVNSAGSISTIAGTGMAGFSGDGGPAASAQINNAVDVAADASGSVYIADYINNRIRRVVTNNHAPYFTGGHTQSLSICVNETDLNVPVNLLLAVMDSDAGQTETWSLVTPPSHGTVLATYSAASTGAIITPTGLTYTPSGTYLGPDVFSVRVTDGTASDTTLVNVMINSTPNPGIISGRDSICPGFTDTLSETVTGGIWSISNSGIAGISTSGISNGFSPGRDTIVYTVINSCGIVSAIFPFVVRSYTACNTAANQLSNLSDDKLQLFPNPNSGAFSVVFNSRFNSAVHLVITDMLGQQLKHFNTISNQIQPFYVDLPVGLYLITATAEDGTRASKLFIKH